MPPKKNTKKTPPALPPKVTKKVISKEKNKPKKAESKREASTTRSASVIPTKKVAKKEAPKAVKQVDAAKLSKKAGKANAAAKPKAIAEVIEPKSKTPEKKSKTPEKKAPLTKVKDETPKKTAPQTTARSSSRKKINDPVKPIVEPKKVQGKGNKIADPPKALSRAAVKAQRKDDEKAKKPVASPVKQTVDPPKKGRGKNIAAATSPVSPLKIVPVVPVNTKPKRGKASKADTKVSPVQIAPATGRVSRQNSKSNDNSKQPAATIKKQNSKLAKQPSKDLSGSKRAGSPPKVPEPVKKVKTDDSEKKIVTAIKKGKCVVDTNCPINNTVHVYETPSKSYDATLNQSNLDRNNNKYYIIQLLEHDTIPGRYYVWNRWGRVGVPGQNALKGPMPLAAAIDDYEKKFKQKTISGEYVALEISYDDDDEKKDSGKGAKGEKKVSTKASTLDPRIQDLINLIFDMKMMTNQMKEIGYDAKKMPLGKLGKNTVKEGYAVLSKIMNEVKTGKNRAEITKLSSEFYTLIPHDFGFKKMIDFILDTEEKVRQKLDMLQSLADIQIASKLLEESSNVDEALIDSNYKKLNCKITALDKKGKEWKLICDYIDNTRQNWKIEVEDIFAVDRIGEDKKFNDKLHNHMHLWHGSRLSNFVGILSQGLRIAPPEAPVSGYLFGKGIYLADMIGKSANYCRSSGSNDTACALICEGALGTPRELFHSDYNASNLPANHHSTKAIGRVAPDEKSFEIINGAKLPTGKVVNNPKGGMGHNEYIVYNENQARIRYLVRMKLSSGGLWW